MLSPKLFNSIELKQQKISRSQLIFISANIAPDIWRPGFWAFEIEETDIGPIYPLSASEQDLEKNLDILTLGIPYCIKCFEAKLEN